MGWSAEKKRQERAEAAGPYPKPRGRAPRGKEWDRLAGEWKPIALPATTTEDSTAVTTTAEDSGALAAVVSWEPPLIWEHTREDNSGWSAEVVYCSGSCAWLYRCAATCWQPPVGPRLREAARAAFLRPAASTSSSSSRTDGGQVRPRELEPMHRTRSAAGYCERADGQPARVHLARLLLTSAGVAGALEKGEYRVLIGIFGVRCPR